MQSGQTVTVEANDLTTIPASLLNDIAGKDITLVIYRTGGDPVVINGLRFTPEPGRLYYVLADIMLLYRNPETGGYSDQTMQLLATLQTLRTADSNSRTLLGPAPDSVRVLDSSLQPVAPAGRSPLPSAIGAALVSLAVLLLAVRMLTKRSLKL